MANKRWNTKKRSYIESQEIDAFLKEIENVCKKHNLLLSHEDEHGAFTVIKRTNENHKRYIDWLNDAHDRTDKNE